ncbi:MAG: hypothetical protein K6G20_06175 [Ruminococcus sp.]|nr:hypothetical protein [Ruminococcus sp.]MCR5729927.1 hypothetical protein [Ruminococcus sp.]
MNVKKISISFISALLLFSVPLFSSEAQCKLCDISKSCAAYEEDLDCDELFEDDYLYDDEDAFDKVDEFEVDEDKGNEDSDSSKSSKKGGGIVVTVLICIAIGLIIAGVVVGSMWAQLKSVHQKNTASDYKRENSFKLNISEDTFLRKEVQKTKRSS